MPPSVIEASLKRVLFVSDCLKINERGANTEGARALFTTHALFSLGLGLALGEE